MAVRLTNQAVVAELVQSLPRDAADAANVSAKVAANTERAWLYTEITFCSNLPDIANQGGTEKSVMVINVINSGRSPAEVEGAQIVTMLCPADWPLPTEPLYEDEQGTFVINSMPGEIIAPEKNKMVISHINRVGLLSDRQINRIRDGQMNLYCYGKITYKDSSLACRVTQFGYFFYVRKSPNDNQPEGMYRIPDKNYNAMR